MADLAKYQIEWVPVSSVNAQNRSFQFRVNFTTEDLEESFKETGQEEPVILWRRQDGELVIISGRRRFTTAQKLGYEKVKAVIMPEQDLSRKDAEDLSLDENIRRKSLTEIDLMNACIRKLQSGESASEIARKTGKSRPTVQDYKLIGDSGQNIQDAIKQGKISAKKAIKILRSGLIKKEGVSAADRGGADWLIDKQKLAENSNMLVEALNSADPKKSVNNLLSGSQKLAFDIQEITSFLDKYKNAIRKRKDFDKPASQATQDATPAPIASKSMYVKGTAKGLEMHVSVDYKRDTLSDLYAKADFLKANAKSFEKTIKLLEKAFKSGKLSAAVKRKPKKTPSQPARAHEPAQVQIPGTTQAQQPYQAQAQANSMDSLEPPIAACDITGLNLTESSIQMSGVSMGEKKLRVGGSINLYVRGDLNGKWFELPDDFKLAWKADKELFVLPGPSHVFTIQLREPVSVFASLTITAMGANGKKLEADLTINSID